MYLPKLKGVSPRSPARPKALFRDGNPVILIPHAKNLRASALKHADGSFAGTILGSSTRTAPSAQHLANTKSALEKSDADGATSTRSENRNEAIQATAARR
jgi:hypothetical protein